jgi:type II secretory pathway pseudopilin PulG
MRKSQRGMSLAEVLVGLMILSVMILTTVTTTSTALSLTKNNVNKEFATQKAISMLEELRAVVQAQVGARVTVLDAYDDGTQNKFILTTQGQFPDTTQTPTPPVTQPEDLISGNLRRGGTWLYERRISVQPVPGQGNDVRFVNVKVFINENGRQRLLAEVASVLRTLVVDMPPTQVYDVYAVAVENVPGWWVYMSNIVPFVKTTISDLQARNPGLQFRTHWIYTLSYGRDWQYKPYLNDLDSGNNPNPSTNDISWAYFYPGRMPDTAANPYYYPWFLFRGTMNNNGTTKNGYHVGDANNPRLVWPYPIADQFNHAMRFEDELAYYLSRKAENPDEELTWRLLIEQMYMDPMAFTNAIVINLHGELLPFPPVRNYSDAAKSPEQYPNVRAVVHPEQLRYSNTEDVKLRVYTYRMDPDNAGAGTNYLGEASGFNIPVTIKITGTTSWTPAGGDVQVIRGGTDQDGAAGADPYDSQPVNAPQMAAGGTREMYYTPGTAGSDIVTLKLYHSPLKHPRVGTGGLDPASRLYGLEYIPSPLEDMTVTNTANQFRGRHLGTRLRTVRDNFDLPGVYNGNNGTDNVWLGPWTEVFDNLNAGSGFIQVVNNPAPGGTNRVRLSDNTPTDTNFSVIEREVDIDNYEPGTAVVSYDWATSAGVDAGDSARVRVSNDNGANWTTLRTYTGTAGVRSGTESVALPAGFQGSDIRFRVELNAGYQQVASPNEEYFYIDNFQVELAPWDADLPKNTARWIITIPASVLTCTPAPCGRKLTIETRLGDQLDSGVMYPTANVPPNVSRTYVWRGDDVWIFGDGAANYPHLPLTEQFQFLGDPRHLPYADLKRPAIGQNGGVNESRLGMGFNRYFDDFESGEALDANRDNIADGNAGAAEIVSATSGNYNITAASGNFAVRVNGVSARVALSQTSGQTPANIATTLNAQTADPDGTGPLVPFATIAQASSFRSNIPGVGVRDRLRIRAIGNNSRTHATTIAYDTVYGNSNGVFNFNGVLAYGNGAGVPWPGWSQYLHNDDNADNDAWSNMEIDVHRAFQMVRTALISSSVLWTTMTGYSYYYMGIGNEIGYDAANNFPNSIPISTMPYTGVSGSNWEQTIIDANGQGCTLGCGVKYIRQQNITAAGWWWSINWLGELYPDSQYTTMSTWRDNGNLRAGAGATFYVRQNRDLLPFHRSNPETAISAFRVPPGTDFVRGERRTGPRGSTTLFWGETATSAFHHVGRPDTDNSTILPDGMDIRDNFSLPVPTTIPTNRPWQIDWNATGDNPPAFLNNAYPPARRLQLLERYYQRDVPAVVGAPTEGSALVSMTDPVTGRPAFIVVNGLSPTGITGTTFIAKWSFLTLIQSFLNGGRFNDTQTYPDPDGTGPLAAPTPGSTFHIRQLPRVEITEPNINTELKNPSTVRVAWSEKWTRWDGKRYSRVYTTGCENTTAGCYTPATTYTRKFVVLYSPSNGAADAANGNPTGWFYADGSSTPNAAPLGARNLSKAVASGMYIDLPTPASRFPEGNYLFRVEEYRTDYPLHYSFHQYRAYIQR